MLGTFRKAKMGNASGEEFFKLKRKLLK